MRTMRSNKAGNPHPNPLPMDGRGNEARVRRLGAQRWFESVRQPSLSRRTGEGQLAAPELPKRRLGGEGAFSLLEMMVAVTLLLLIITALLGMFYQTQRAFRQSATQVDVQEGMRATAERLTGEIPEITRSYQAGSLNLFAETAYPFLIQPRPSAPSDPAMNPRVNIIQDIFFIRQHDDTWIGTGYFVVSYASDPVGTLYRVEKSGGWNDIPGMFTFFNDSIKHFPTNSPHRVLDRVVALKLTPYDYLGQYLTNAVDANYSFTRSFTNGVLPSYLDLELGVLEPKVFEKYKALADISSPADPRAYRYLSNHVEAVHVFRQRIPLRTAQ